MRHWAWIALLMGVMAACAPAPDVLPTLAPSATATEAPSATPSATATPAASATPTLSPTASASPTATATPTQTHTPTATFTFTPSATRRASATPTATANAIASATALRLEQPAYATFTPLPLNGTVDFIRPTSTGTPEIIADVRISPSQFQEELAVQAAALGGVVQDVQATFAPAGSTPQGIQGIRVQLSAASNGAFATGSFVVYFALEANPLNPFLQITADSPADFIMSGAALPGDDFIQTAYNDVLPAVIGALDAILEQRLGTDKHNLDSLRITADAIEVSLLVPIAP